MIDRGIFYTIGILLLIIPLILFVAYYATTTQTKRADTISKIRCDELHYFVEDLRGDLGRALVIFGRRATIYAIDDVVKTGRPLKEYRFNCSEACNVDCSMFRFDVNGSEAALAELMICGTLHGQNVSYMTNHSISQWIVRIAEQGHDMHFNVSIKPKALAIIPKDPWTYTVYTNSSFNVYDESGTCYFVGDNIVTSSATSILGLEDPLYPINTNSYVIKFINNCSTQVNTQLMAGCSLAGESHPGNHSATGTVLLMSQITEPLDTYCDEHAATINQTIIVVDTAFGAAPCRGNKFAQCCFNISCPNHFAGAVNYDKNRYNPFVEQCDITIPWIAATGEMDNELPNGGGNREPGCDQSYITDGSCVEISNDEDCGLHQVLVGQDAESLNTTCYQLSNVTQYGTSVGYDGPSFFDRLDGVYNLSEKYTNQSWERFNTRLIGMETLVSPYELDRHDVTVKTNATWVDYLYWKGVYGCGAKGICPGSKFAFRLDDPHVLVYGADTKCAAVPGCPNSAETCVNGVDDDNDTKPDWLDYDCSGYFIGCGTIKACGLSSEDVCDTCDDPAPTSLAENTTTKCSYYGYNTSEWHFYSITPTLDGRLTVRMNSTSNVTGDEMTDLNIYNYSLEGGSCSTGVHHVGDLEAVAADYCVLAGETYMLGFDVNAPQYGYNGSYALNVTVTPDPTCMTGTTTSTTTSTTTTSTTTTSTTLCGFYDDMETNRGWAPQNEWERGDPSKGGAFNDCKSGSNCWVTDLSHDYDNNMNESVTSPLVDLSFAASPSISYLLLYRTENNADWIFVETSRDGVNWNQLVNYTSRNWLWTKYSYPIPAYAGGSFRVRFRLKSDNMFNYDGAAVDDVNISCG